MFYVLESYELEFGNALIEKFKGMNPNISLIYRCLSSENNSGTTSFDICTNFVHSAYYFKPLRQITFHDGIIKDYAR